MKKQVIIVGASGHGKVVYSVCLDLGLEVIGFYDQNEQILDFCSLPVFHREDTLPPENYYMIGIGNNRHRENLANRLQRQFISCIHPSAVVHKSVDVGEGTIIMHNATIQIDSYIGKHVIVNTSCSIDHDCRLEDFSHISPNATLAGNVSVGKGSWIGAGATILQGVKIGEYVKVGAGAVILNDIPDHAVVVGVPGKIIKFEK
ncbi:acetyltransferase [Mongoliitalea lutea]|uniref:Acetyltransferase n=1 Tax=Mongoliitalea lutea TaxID=849756 RepID=A0A8J3G4N8_9BACT|nr:acetyltransferase [Mongoliitalea lutea]GHB31321.1 acetyltransferase [Mongoliitalea lutea]